MQTASSNQTYSIQFSPVKQIQNNQFQKPSSFKQSMKKSVISKMSGYSSILNAVTSDENLQILRISLKKQLDRKEKLERLMDKYEQITTQQKTHIKEIKSNIIELKDIETNSKTKFFLNPVIYVDNSLSKQTREYLCMLLNTFYAKYEENSEFQFKTKQLEKDMNHLLQSISSNEENLLKIEKETIGVQVYLQGEMLGLKAKIKDENQKQKELQQEHKRVGDICKKYENEYNIQLQKVQKLRKTSQQIQNQIDLYRQHVADGQAVKKGKQQMMANEIAYQQRFQTQLQSVDKDIQKQKQRSSILENKIKQKKFKVEQMKTKLSKLDNLVEQMKSSKIEVQNSNKKGIKMEEFMLQGEYFEMKKSCCSLSKIKRYSQVMDLMNKTLQGSKCNKELKFGYDVMSKDAVNHSVGMKIIEIRNERNTASMVQSSNSSFVLSKDMRNNSSLMSMQRSKITLR